MGRASREKPARLAEKLLQIRTALALSQKGMLRSPGIAEKGYRNYISDFENGVREPSLPVLLKYARTCAKEKIVDFKRACPACVSYIFIVKRFQRFGFCLKGAYDGVKFQNLEEEIYGVPPYKQEWLKRRRARKKG